MEVDLDKELKSINLFVYCCSIFSCLKNANFSVFIILVVFLSLPLETVGLEYSYFHIGIHYQISNGALNKCLIFFLLFL